jgi:hypothetical protein
MQRHAAVVPARWWHLPGLSALIRETRRLRSLPDDAPGQPLVWASRWSPSLALLQSVWTAPMPGMRVPMSYVAEVDGKPVGLGQIRPRREEHQWEVAYLAVSAPNPHADGGLRLVPDRNASRLLGELCDASVRQSATRILARVIDGGGRYELFRQLGFSLAVREYSYFRTLTGHTPAPGRPAELAKRVPGLRPQRRHDADGILRLYERNTPRTVRMAEGKRSQSWDEVPVGLTRRLTHRSGIQRWVVERDGERLGWLQIQRTARGPHHVSIIVDERAGELNQSLVDFALDSVAGHPANREAGVLVRVREHQPRLISALEGSQFFLVDAQLLMVKMLATPVMQPSFAPVLEKVV